MDTLLSHINTVDDITSLKNLNDFYSLITSNTEEDLKELLNKTRDKNIRDAYEHCKCDYGKNLYNIAEDNASNTADTTADDTADTADTADTVVSATSTTHTTNYMQYVFNTVAVCSMLFNSVCLAKLAFLS